jgi:hypothetical protein
VGVVVGVAMASSLVGLYGGGCAFHTREGLSFIVQVVLGVGGVGVLRVAVGVLRVAVEVLRVAVEVLRVAVEVLRVGVGVLRVVVGVCVYAGHCRMKWGFIGGGKSVVVLFEMQVTMGCVELLSKDGIPGDVIADHDHHLHNAISRTALTTSRWKLMMKIGRGVRKCISVESIFVMNAYSYFQHDISIESSRVRAMPKWRRHIGCLSNSILKLAKTRRQ